MAKCVLPRENIINVRIGVGDQEIDYVSSGDISLDFCSALLRFYRYIRAGAGLSAHVSGKITVYDKSIFKDISADVAIEPESWIYANIYKEPRLQAGINSNVSTSINKMRDFLLSNGIDAHSAAKIFNGVISRTLEGRIPLWNLGAITLYREAYVKDYNEYNLVSVNEVNLQDLYLFEK